MLDEARFFACAHGVARQVAGRVGRVYRPNVTPNFIAAEIVRRTGSLFLLCSHDGHWALTAEEPQMGKLDFCDDAEVERVLREQFDVTILSATALSNAVDTNIFASSDDVKYWKPQTVGDALFNWWD